jgi:subtilisin family serine protease
MSSNSCYANPESPHGDREKPEVAAPGTNITTTYCTSSSTCTGTGSGTSFAAPHVTGCAALLMQRNPTLQYWPEAVRAVLMASAVENLEGDPTLSDLDGAGGVDCYYADQILTEARGTMSYGFYAASDFPRSYSFNVNAGQTVRVVVAWDSNADSSAWPPATDILEADLDLTVYGPSSEFIAGRYSWDNAFEIVEFTAPVTGTYSANISAFRFDGDSEYLGFAVWKGARKK